MSPSVGSALESRLRPEHPVTLALLRVAVCLLVLASPEVISAPRQALLPAALRTPPEGLAWFVVHVPITPRLAQVAQLGVALGAFAGLVGYRPRLAMGAVTLFGFYTFALSQLDGAVLHDMHLLWFAAILAVSPCADALTLTERGWGPPYARSAAYSLPLAVVRALFAAVYFFPGAWKLQQSGLSWALSDNLRNQMYAKWFEWGGWLPPVRIDEHPLVLRTAALSVLVFELGFPLLMLGRRTRVMAALGGLAFHLGGALFLRIHFAGLWLCYVALIDWGPIVDRIRSFRDGASRALPARGRDQEAPPNAITRAHGTQAPVAWVGALLVGAALVQGMRGATFAWPFGCYPTFQWRATTTLPDLELEALFDDGRSVVIDSGGEGRGRPQSGWATVWSLAGIAHAPRSATALRVYWNRVDHARARGAVRGSVALVTWSVLPEDRNRPPLSKQVIATFALDVQSGAAP